MTRPADIEIHTLADLLQVFYPLPEPYSTHEEWERANHRDLDDFDLDDLHRELRRLRQRLDLDPRPDPWLMDREQAILDAMRRQPQPAPKPVPLRPRAEPAKPTPEPARRTVVYS